MQIERINSDKLKLRDLAIASSFRFSPSVHLWVMLSINFSDIETPQDALSVWVCGMLGLTLSNLSAEPSGTNSPQRVTACLEIPIALATPTLFLNA